MARETIGIGPGAMALGQGRRGGAQDGVDEDEDRASRSGSSALFELAIHWFDLPRGTGRLATAAAGTWLVALLFLAGLLADGEVLAQPAGRVALAVAVLLPAVALFLLALGLARLQQDNLRLAARVWELGGIDLLTGVTGRDRFMEAAEQEFGRFRRYDQPLAAIRLSVDFYNRLTDAYGTEVADQLLMRLAALMQAELRDSDRVGRLGEAEFAALLPGVDSDGASVPATRICAAAAELALPSELGDLRFTVSVGVTHAQANDRDGQALLRRAKVALGAAVFAGRNRVALSDGVVLFPGRGVGPRRH